MIQEHRYEIFDKKAKRFLESIYAELSNKSGDYYHEGLVGDLSGYLVKDGAVVLDEGQTKISLQIGPYKFFMMSEVRLSNDKHPIVIYTYEDVQQMSRRLPTGKPKVELIPDLTLTCDGDTYWTMKGWNKNIKIVHTYCKELIKYIEGIEKEKSYRITHE